MNVITRFPPSPTGKLQLGNARTALFNYLFAKHHGGSFLFRLEDTDRERSKKEYEEDIIGSLAWLGIAWDNKEVWRQSERSHVYKSSVQKLVDAGAAYVSEEEAGSDPASPKLRRASVIRFRNPNKRVTFTDLIRGDISFDTTELGDFVIAKSMEEPMYHLAVVVDDEETGVTHVIRGEDGISNTPRQILIQEALRFPRPVYAHLPLILAPDRSKLSKRKGAIPVSEYRVRGYIPEAALNYLALLGWNPGGDREIFSLNELVALFDIAKAQKGGAVFNEEKMRSINREYIKRAGGAKAVLPHIPAALSEGKSDTQRQALSEMLFERISVYGDIETELREGEYNYLAGVPDYSRELLKWKKADEEPQAHLERVAQLLEQIPTGKFTKEQVKAKLTPYAVEKGKGNVLWPMRVALSGREQSPDPFTLAAVFGKETALRRLRQALNMLQLTS